MDLHQMHMFALAMVSEAHELLDEAEQLVQKDTSRQAKGVLAAAQNLLESRSLVLSKVITRAPLYTIQEFMDKANVVSKHYMKVAKQYNSHSSPI